MQTAENISWNDCVRVGSEEDILKSDSRTFSAYLKYIGSIDREPTSPVWYDPGDGVCFGADQIFFSNPADFSFFHHEEFFLTHEPWGKKHTHEVLGKHLGDNTVQNRECIIQDHPEFSKFENKRILMIGAGPTAGEVDLDKLENEYDFVWSCNNFYKGEKFKDLKIDLMILGPDVDLEDPVLHERLKRDETFCVFEGGVSPFRSGEELARFKNQYPEKTSYFHLRYFSKIGTMPRLLCLGTFLGAEKILFAGIDGYPGKEGENYAHVFEGKEKSHDGRVFSLNLHRRQYVLLWEYLLGQKNCPEFQNLGEGHPANLTSDISKKHFPLNTGV